MNRILILMASLLLAGSMPIAAEESTNQTGGWEFKVNAQTAVDALECSAIYFIETAGSRDDIDENKRLTFGGLFFLDIYSAAKREAVRQTLGEEWVPSKEELIRDRDWRLASLWRHYWHDEFFPGSNHEEKLKFISAYNRQKIASAAIDCDEWLDVIKGEHYAAVVGKKERTPSRLKRYLLSVPERVRHYDDALLWQTSTDAILKGRITFPDTRLKDRGLDFLDSLVAWNYEDGLVTPTFTNKQLREKDSNYHPQVRPPPGSNVIDCFGLKGIGKYECWVRHITQVTIDPYGYRDKELLAPLEDRIIIAATHFLSKNFSFETVRAYSEGYGISPLPEEVRNATDVKEERDLLWQQQGWVQCEFRLAEEEVFDPDSLLALLSSCQIWGGVLVHPDEGFLPFSVEDLTVTSRKSLYSDIEKYLARSFDNERYGDFDRRYNSGQYLAGKYYSYSTLDKFEDEQVRSLHRLKTGEFLYPTYPNPNQCRRVKERIRDAKKREKLLARYECD